MGRYRKTRRIEASPEQVFRAFTDPAIVADWMEADGIVDQRGSLDSVGSTYTLVIAGPWRFRMRVLHAVPSTDYALEGEGPLGTTSRIAATMTSHGEVTELVVDTEWTLPLGPIGRWIDRRWVEPGTRGEEDRELDRLVDHRDRTGVGEPDGRRPGRATRTGACLRGGEGQGRPGRR